MSQLIGIYKETRKTRQKKWVIRWNGEYNAITGKQVWYSRQFATKNEAESFLVLKRQEFSEGLPRDKAKAVTLRQFCDEWIEARKHELRPATQEMYLGVMKRLKKFFGDNCQLTDISEKKAELFLAQQKILTKGREGNSLADWSRQQLKRQCQTILNKAVSWQLIRVNPFQHIKLKKATIKRWHRVTTAEYLRLLEAAPNNRWRAFYALAYTAGLRLGEILALQWGDIDFEKCNVNIANRVGTDRTPPFEIKDSDTRTVPIPSHTVDILVKWQSEAPEGVPYVVLDEERYKLVLIKWHKLRKEKKPWRNRLMANNSLRDFKQHLKRANIKPDGKLSIHTLRKSFGQNLADHLPMNVVKELMGHSSIATTAEFYNQVDKQHRIQAANSIQNMLEKAEKDSETVKG